MNCYPSVFKILRFQPKEIKKIDPLIIIDIVCGYFRISKMEILGNSQTEGLSDARYIAMYFIHKHRDVFKVRETLTSIGRIFSNRKHCTVIYALRKVEDLQSNREFRNNFIQIKGIVDQWLTGLQTH